MLVDYREARYDTVIGSLDEVPLFRLNIGAKAKH